MKKVKKDICVRNCPICKHVDRAGIEMLGVLSAANWRIATERINNTFETDFTVACVRKHMMEHPLHNTAVEAGEILDSALDPDKPVITTQNMLRTLIIQGAQDLAKGKLKVRNVQELLAVMNQYEAMRRQEQMQMAMEEGDATAYYAAMAAYAEAIQDTVSPQQMAAIVMKANALGATFNIANVAQSHNIDLASNLALAVHDVEDNGRARTRNELIEAGAIEIEGVVLPDD